MTTIKLRRGTAAEWTSGNPILNDGELGFERDTNKHKIGDGVTHWIDLAYFVDQNSMGRLPTNTVSNSGASQTLPSTDVARLNVLTLTANCTLTFPTGSAGRFFHLVLKQDATGSRIVTWPVGIKWPMDIVPTLQTAANAVDEFTFLYPSTSWRGSLDASYSS